MAKYNFNELSIESLISAPLVAASKANVLMVTGQTRFLLENCFDQKDEDTYEPKLIIMSLKKGIIDNTEESKESNEPADPTKIKVIEMTFSIPLLCIVPINSLAIDQVTVDFDLEITSVTSSDTASDDDKKQRLDSGIMDQKAQLNGKISYNPNEGSSDSKTSQYRSQMSSRLKVHINAGPLPLPVGVLSILDLYTKSIQPVPKAGVEKK
jgi:hypothetical protein